jgi:hypothetical protein
MRYTEDEEQSVTGTITGRVKVVKTRLRVETLKMAAAPMHLCISYTEIKFTKFMYILSPLAASFHDQGMVNL